MAVRNRTGFGRLFLLGLALAYLATGLVDKPAPIRFRERAAVSGQGSARETDGQAVLRMNIFKLGDPLSMQLLSPEAAAESGGESWSFKRAVKPFANGDAKEK